jgi:hypothetical protein
MPFTDHPASPAMRRFTARDPVSGSSDRVAGSGLGILGDLRSDQDEGASRRLPQSFGSKLPLLVGRWHKHGAGQFDAIA